MEESLRILYALIIGAIVIVVSILVVKVKISQASDTYSNIMVDSLTYSKCSAYCLSCYYSDCKCTIKGQSYDCDLFRNIGESLEDIAGITEIYSPYPARIVATSSERCKVSSLTYLSSKQKEDLEKSVMRSIDNYDTLVKKHAVSISPCLVHAIIAAESSGGINKVTQRNGRYYSCGITMIAPSTYRSLTKSKCSDEECCNKLANDDDLAIKLAIDYLINGVFVVDSYVNKYRYPKDKILKLSYLLAYYNGGEKALKPSSDCSFSKCNQLKDILVKTFGEVSAIPAFACAYKPGGYIETQEYVRKVLYAYSYCNSKQNDEVVK